MAKSAYNEVPARDNGHEQVEEEEPENAFEDECEQPTTTNALSFQNEGRQPDDALACTVDEAIERLGMGRFQFVILTASGLCFAADAMQVLLLTFLSEVLRSEWNLSVDETAMITSMLFIGAIFGTLSLGPLADRKGRKPVFLLAASIISIFGTTVAMVDSYWALLANLFMVGWGIGGLTVPFDILAEFLPSNARGKNLLAIEYFWTVGVLFVVVIAYFTLGNGEETENWRLFVTICIIPCWLSVVIGYFFVPESPRWLCSQGRYQETIEVLRHAAKTNGHDAQLLYPDGMRLVDKESEDSNFCELFGPRWRWTTLTLWGVWGFSAFGYYGTVMAITNIFDTEGDSGAGPERRNNFDYSAIFESSSAELVGTTIAILSIDVFGRVPLMVVAYAMAGMFVCALYVSAAYECDRSVLIAFGFGARIAEMISTCVTWVSTAEILTTEVRTTGHSAANAVGRIGALSSPFLIQGDASMVKKGLIMLVIHAGTVIFASMLPETKGSRMGSTQDDAIGRNEAVGDMDANGEAIRDRSDHESFHG